MPKSNMSLNRNPFPSLLITAGLCALGCGPLAQSVQAQGALAQSAPAAPAMGTAASVLDRIGRGVGVTILADSTIQARVLVPADPTTAQNVSQQVADVMKALPASARWVELYVPKPAQHRAWNADDLVAYVNAQKRAFGDTGQPAIGTIDILGRHLPSLAAQPILRGLDLQRVCVVTDPGHHPVAEAPAMADWPQMPRAEQKAYMQQTAAQILSMPESDRQPLMDQLKYYDLLKDEMEKQAGHDLGW